MARTRLLGPDGQPIDTRRLTGEEATPSLGGVRSILSGSQSAGLSPGKLALVLRQAIQDDPLAYLELAEEMEERDLHYLAVLGTRKRQVAQLEVTVEPAGDDQAALDIATFVEDIVIGDGLADVLIELLDAVAKGFSVLEIVWETSERSWRPRDLCWRDPRWFRFDRADGRGLMLRTDDSADGVPLAPWKFVQHVHRAKSGLPIRGGLARAVAWFWMFKHFDVGAWISFAERFGQPIRLGKYGPEATPEDKRTLLRAVTEIARDAAAIIPASMQVDLIEAKMAGSLDLFERLADWIDRQVSKAVLGQTTTTDAVSGGHAVSQEHEKVREDIERSDARQVAKTLCRDLVRPLVDLNFGPQESYPTLRIGRPEEIDAGVVVDALPKLVPLGFRIAQQTVRDILGLPAPEEGDELLSPSSGAPATDPGAEPDGDDPAAETPVRASAPAEDTPPDPIEALVARLAADGELDAAMSPITGPLAAVAAAAGDYETFKARIAEHLQSADVGQMAELLARATFFGVVAGRVGAGIDEPK